MLYAKVVTGLPVEGPFDYIVPASLNKKIKAGSRAWVNFGAKKMLGYVVGLAAKTKVKNLKNILELIDEYPVLDKNMLSLTKELSLYYCCAWGEAIETALPEDLRKGKRIPDRENSIAVKTPGNREIMLMHDLDGRLRWNEYLKQIKEVLSLRESAIILLPDINSVLNAKKIIESSLDSSLGILYRKEPKEIEEWSKIKAGRAEIVIGTRSSIFAPLGNLGLVIIDEEQDPVYKQDQVPHYNAREVALMRVTIEKAKLVLGSAAPSLESFYLAQKNKIKYILLPRTRNLPQIKIVDMRLEFRGPKKRDIILSKYLNDAIISCLNSGEKALLFLNRKGFATFASCHNCGVALRCPRCNINLVYHFKDNILECHYCNFKIEPPKICPNCNSGYIKYSGTGTEKIESELSRIFPQARIKRIDGQCADINEADIFIAASSIIKQTSFNFDLIGVLSIDNSLNRIDFRASEKAFVLLAGLLGLTEKKIVIQTNLPGHHCFQALLKKDMDIFYKEELRQRKQLNFPPHKHLILIKLRGKKEDRVKRTAYALFDILQKCNKDKRIKIISVNPAHPSKLRGNFYWQLLIIAASMKKISKFLKIHLKNFSHSGIIVTIDIDPS